MNEVCSFTATDAYILDVAESSQLGEARRQIIKTATESGLSEANRARLDLVCLELCTNLVKHVPNGGKLIVQVLRHPSSVGMEIFSIDTGRGMNIEKALTDGYSSTGTMGTGLGSIKRNSDSFNIYSETGAGSIIHLRIWNSPKVINEYHCQAAFTVPKTGELVSGDKWSILENENTTNCLLIDGLGHGFEACEAANLAIKRFKELAGKPPEVVLKAIHQSLKGTRGAVGALAQIDHEHGKIHFCGLGNIAAVVERENEHKHLTSLNGTLGYEARKFLEITEKWTPHSTLIMHSDGLSSKTFEDLYTICREVPAIAAAKLYQKYSKGIDDSTILICKERR